MKLRIAFTEIAGQDIADAINWYENQRGGLGEKFLRAVQSAAHEAAAHPSRYPQMRRRPDVGRVLTRGFPYRIFFVRRPNAIIVFRVLHGARHDRGWRSSIPES